MASNSGSTTVTKDEIVRRVADLSDNRRREVHKIIQNFLDQIIDELSKGNRLEFRGFGIFETKKRAARMAQNPKTLETVMVPSKRHVRFRAGNIMKEKIQQKDV